MKKIVGFILPHITSIVEEGPPTLFFDRERRPVPPAVASGAAPNQGKFGELEWYEPKPGHGYYAHLTVASDQINRDPHWRVKTVEVVGPDWLVSVRITTIGAAGPASILPTIVKWSAGLEEFFG